MKVLYYSRDFSDVEFGGDTVQMNKTAKALQENFDVSVELGGISDLRSKNYDLVHFFNVRCPQDILEGVRHCVKNNVPYVLSTIYGSYKEGDQKARSGLISVLGCLLTEFQLEYLKILARSLLRFKFSVSIIWVLLRGYLKAQKYILSHAKVILPNSDTEATRLIEVFELDSVDIKVIVNGYDDKLFVLREGETKKIRSGVLCVSRIESRKGILDLVNAAKILPDVKFTIVGKSSKFGRTYYDNVLKTASENVTFINFTPQDKLVEIYASHLIHILPSWIETPGLSSLEAAAMGCSLIVTDRGDTEWYFGDSALYCEPGNPRSIARCITKALKEPRYCCQEILAKFTWDEAAAQTYDVYRDVLKSNNL